MSAVIFCIISAAILFAGSLLGIYLRERLPGHHLRDDSKDTVKVGAGIVSTVAALVLGLLVSSAKNSYDTMNAEITNSASKVVLLDRLLANYGDETRAVRNTIREALSEAIDQVWIGGEGNQGANLGRINYLEQAHLEILNLSPSTDAQRAYLAHAQQLIYELRETRWLLVEQSHNELPHVFIFVLVFWLLIMHVSFGLFAPRNSTAITVLLISSVSMSCAIFLILELNHPLHGVIRIGGATMQGAVELLGK